MTPVAEGTTDSTRSIGLSAEGAGLEPDPMVNRTQQVSSVREHPAPITLLSAMLAAEVRCKSDVTQLTQ